MVSIPRHRVRHVYLDKNTIPKDFEELALKINNLISVFYEHVVEKEKLEQSIYYNQRLESVGALASAISHDFNNVLTYMYTYADLILDELDQNSLEHQRAQELIFAIDHATALTEQISLFSRNVKREMKPTSFSKVLEGSMKLMVPTFQRSINVTIINPEEDLMVLADQTSLHQIIINLCTNAYHALIDHGDKLEVQLKSRTLGNDEFDGLRAGEYAYLCISDNGKGMPIEVLNRIFDPYFTTKVNGQGSGMGLTIVYRLVSNLQGKIWAESEVGKGTVFHLLIPLIQ